MNQPALQPSGAGAAAGDADAPLGPFFTDDQPDPTNPDAPEQSALPPPPVGSRRRRWLWLSGVLLAAAGAGGILLWRQSRAPVQPTVESVKTDRGRIVVQVTASGTVSALKTVLVGSQVSGRVAELHADFNDQVKKGQLLARLDTQLFKSAVEQAQASLAVARSNGDRASAQLLEAQRNLGRSQTLAGQRFLAQEVVDNAASDVAVARAAVVGARAQVQQATASLRQAELNLAMTAIYSPIDGVVISRSVDVGQTVAASLQAPTIFTLAEDLRRMQVEAHVAEGDVSKLGPGMPVTFTVDAFAGQNFSGKLRQVRNAATTVQSVVTYDAIVDVDNPELKLRPGMTANVSFVVADRRDVVRIPNAALRLRPSREALARFAPAGQPAGAGGPGSRTVFVSEGAGLRPVRVRVGVTDGSRTELVEGELGEGVALVTDLGDGASSAAGRAGAGNRPGGSAIPIGATAGPTGPGLGTGGGRRR